MARRTSRTEDLVAAGVHSYFFAAQLVVFYQQYEEYELNIKISNSGQPAQRPLLSNSQLLPRSARSGLRRTLFSETHEAGVEECDLHEA